MLKPSPIGNKEHSPELNEVGKNNLKIIKFALQHFENQNCTSFPNLSTNCWTILNDKFGQLVHIIMF